MGIWELAGGSEQTDLPVLYENAAEHACINSFLLLTGCEVMPSEAPAAWTSLLPVTATWNCGLDYTLSPISGSFAMVVYLQQKTREAM